MLSSLQCIMGLGSPYNAAFDQNNFCIKASLVKKSSLYRLNVLCTRKKNGSVRWKFLWGTEKVFFLYGIAAKPPHLETFTFKSIWCLIMLPTSAAELTRFWNRAALILQCHSWNGPACYSQHALSHDLWLLIREHIWCISIENLIK